MEVIYLFMNGLGVPLFSSLMDRSVSPVIPGDPDAFIEVPVEGDRWNNSWQRGQVLAGLHQDTILFMHPYHQQQ